MGKLQAITKRGDRNKGVSLTLGVDSRMYLSSGLKELLNHNQKADYFLFYDHEDGRIGISVNGPDDSNVEPFRFNKTGEGRVVSFVEDCEINIPGEKVTWIYEGKEGDIMIFFPQRTP